MTLSTLSTFCTLIILRQILTIGKTVLETWHLRHWLQFWRLRTWIQSIIVTWQLIVTLDSIRNSCDVLRVEMSKRRGVSLVVWTLFKETTNLVTSILERTGNLFKIVIENLNLFRIVIELFKVVIENWDWISSKDCDWIVMNILTKSCPKKSSSTVWWSVFKEQNLQISVILIVIVYFQNNFCLLSK